MSEASQGKPGHQILLKDENFSLKPDFVSRPHLKQQMTTKNPKMFDWKTIDKDLD